MNIILFIFWIALVLYVLLETDAIPKWAELFGLTCFKYNEFKEKQQMFGDLKYKNFLATYYPSFPIFLLTCQECLCIWLNILGFCFLPAFLGGWSYFGVASVGSLVCIAGLNFVLKKLYE